MIEPGISVLAVGICLVSPVVASFALLLADRMRQGRGLDLWGRSRCDHCDAVLTVDALIPILSWIRFGGRSRCCLRPLRWRLVAVELVALLGAIWAAFLTSGPVLIASAMLLWVLLWLCLVDLDQFRLPDSGTLPLILAGLALALGGVTGAPLWHALGAVAGYAVVAVLRTVWWHLRGVEAIGLGDAKLLAAAGAWCGLVAIPSVLLWACATGLSFALVSGIRNGSLQAQTAIPFGPAIALGFWVTWLHGPLVF